jgi:hypothetical protein
MRNDAVTFPQLKTFIKTTIHSLAATLLTWPALLCSAAIQQGEMAGYLFGRAEKVQEEFNGGFSLYAAVRTVHAPLTPDFPAGVGTASPILFSESVLTHR